MKSYQRRAKNFTANALHRTRRYRSRFKSVSRSTIIKRDKSICYLCGRFIPRKFIVLDHIVPLVRGGQHVETNLKVACCYCNNRKGTKLLHELPWLTSEILERAGVELPPTSNRLTEPELRISQ
jgi:5-methylcytosine-specific restriction endonuclease McrA